MASKKGVLLVSSSRGAPRAWCWGFTGFMPGPKLACLVLPTDLRC